MFLAQVKANEIKREAVSEYKKEDEIDKLKKEVNCLLKKIKELGNIEIENSVFGSTDHTRVKARSNGDLFLGERYLDEQMGYYRTRMNKVTINDIPEKHKIAVLNMQKELMEDVLNNFSNENSREK